MISKIHPSGFLSVQNSQKGGVPEYPLAGRYPRDPKKAQTRLQKEQRKNPAFAELLALAEAVEDVVSLETIQ
ncbi:MAG: hypothetical protein OEW12_07945 [Deltaproteobacteria bacterium]|nr:hypothetical protein [Deltaproteobacteria bacterium]